MGSSAMRDAPVTALVTGAAGLLGTWLRRTAPAGWHVVPLTFRRRLSAEDVRVDLRDHRGVAAAFAAVQPDVVIHAAYARDEASVVDATRNVAAAAREAGAGLVIISTEAVFSGDGLPRAETARPDPVWDYGRWKAIAEQSATDADPAAAIVRLPLIVSIDPHDHIISDIRRGQERGKPAVWFTDEIRQPANASELAEAVWRIATLAPEVRAGPWHLPGAERLSRSEIAARACARVGLDPDAVVASQTPAGARRPRDLHLTGERAATAIGWAPTRIYHLP